MIGRNLDDAEEWLRSWTAQASARAEAAQQMSERVAGLTSTASVADGAITVTVAGSGVLTGLELDDRVQRMPGRDLAAQIMRAVQKAQSGLNAKVATVVEETVGPESETGQAVLGSFERRFPDVPDDEPDRDRDDRGRDGGRRA
jgi:DNA-binding protein YbaB